MGRRVAAPMGPAAYGCVLCVCVCVCVCACEYAHVLCMFVCSARLLGKRLNLERRWISIAVNFRVECHRT